MPICPKCNTSLKDDYGMVTCPTCSSILFIDMEGIAHMSTTESGSTAMDAASPLEPMPSSSTPTPDMGLSFVEPMGGGAAAAEVEMPAGDFSMDQFMNAQPVAPAAIEPPSVDFNEGAVDPNDPLGVSSFANSELSQGKDGLYLYKVVISGIDSKELKENIRQELFDSRFGWDVKALLGSMTKGTLIFDQLSPIKASILVNRLKRYPVKIHWQQQPITQI